MLKRGLNCFCLLVWFVCLVRDNYFYVFIRDGLGFRTYVFCLIRDDWYMFSCFFGLLLLRTNTLVLWCIFIGGRVF